MSNKMIAYRTPDGTAWGVEVSVSGPSNALVIFHHPDGHTSRRDRYSWLNWHGAQASDVTVSLTPDVVRPTPDEHTLDALFKRSMPIGDGLQPARIFA